ncbi:MAG TPA: sodium/solute symporter [Candidatus Hydrogenedentes bacterium]|nr:sodium/solute symporter [Candidatus Hydrogenedentota bacterium]HPG70270.1 sodium/solute symporter [Candidatus Hydrogenedentota bacterium]
MPGLEGALGLAGIDIAIIIIYMVGVFVLGTFFGKYVRNAGDFFIAGKALPFWAIGMSIVVSDIGAMDFVGVAGSAYTHGIAVANFDWIGSMPAMVFAAFVFVPYFWRSGVFTIPEFLGRRYNAAVQVIHGTIWAVFLFTMLSLMLWVTADKLMYVVLGWNRQFTIWLMALITGVYTFSGGLSAVVMVDVVQMIIMFVGGLSLLMLSLWQIGGWGALREQLTAAGHADHLNILLPHNTDLPYPWTGIVFGLGIVLAIAYMSGNQVIVQRTLGARSEWHAKGGMLFGGFLKSFIPLMVAIPGLSALVLIPGLKDGDTAVPEMIRLLLPPGLRGLMFVALFAALISSVDSTLNSTTTIWTTDILGRFKQLVTGVAFGERHVLILGRVFTVLFIILAALVAPVVGQTESVYVFIQTALSLFQGPTLAILLLGVCWRRATRWGGLAGLVLGVGFTFILNFTEGLFPSEDPFLFVAWWSFVFSLIVTVVVSLCTPPEPDEKIRGLVWGQVVSDGVVQRILTERVSS